MHAPSTEADGRPVWRLAWTGWPTGAYMQCLTRQGQDNGCPAAAPRKRDPGTAEQVMWAGCNWHGPQRSVTGLATEIGAEPCARLKPVGPIGRDAASVAPRTKQRNCSRAFACGAHSLHQTTITTGRVFEKVVWPISGLLESAQPRGGQPSPSKTHPLPMPLPTSTRNILVAVVIGFS